MESINKIEIDNHFTPLNITLDNDSEIVHCSGSEVYIKMEPHDPEEVDEENTAPLFPVENVVVKVEPGYFDNDEAMDLSVTTQNCVTGIKRETETCFPPLLTEIKCETRDSEDDSDEEYIPPKQSSKKRRKVTKQPNVKPTFKRKKESDMLYPDNVTKHIEIVTITETERQVEHKEVWYNRKHMRYTCEDCAIGFVIEEAYLMHMKIHSPESGDHECDLCHARVKTADVLYKHKLRHYRRYRCTLCLSLHKDKETAACHVNTEHAGQAFICTHCGKGFKRPQYLKKHVEQQHTKSNRFECPVCQWVCHERSRYRSHYRTHNEEVKTKTVQQAVICDTCSRPFKNKNYLKRHLLTHENGAVACPICFHTCKNNEVLRTHYRRAHSDEDDCVIREASVDRQCPQCMRICASRALLRHHMRRMHTDRTKKYQCDHCQRLYLTKGEVRSHIMWSHMRRPGRGGGGHGCGCGRVFRTPALLRAHEARDHLKLPQLRVHACTDCDKAFTSTQVLKRHMRIHSNETFPCKECGVEFKTQSYVQVHYKIKHLNMTRQELKAQRKPKVINTIYDTSGKSKKRIKKSKKKLDPEIDLKVFENDDVEIKIKREDDGKTVDEIRIPLFQTFADVSMESEALLGS